MLIWIVVIYVRTRYGQYSPTYLLRDIKHSATHLLRDIKHSATHLLRDIKHSATHLLRDIKHSATHLLRDIKYSATHLLRDIKHSATHLLRDIKYSATHLPLTSTKKYEPSHLGLKLQVRCLLFCSLNRSNYSTISVPHKHHPTHSSHTDGSYVSVFRHTTPLNIHVNIHINTTPHHRNLTYGVNKCNVSICDKLVEPAVETKCTVTVHWQGTASVIQQNVQARDRCRCAAPPHSTCTVLLQTGEPAASSSDWRAANSTSSTGDVTC
jgi:hypothetical protein